jgi:hypothetical protein
MRLHEQYHNPGRPTLDLRDIAEFLLFFREEIMTQLQDLQAAVQAEDTVIQSAVTLINGIADRIAAAGTDPAALQALTDDINMQAQALAAAVTANTPTTGS